MTVAFWVLALVFALPLGVTLCVALFNVLTNTVLRARNTPVDDPPLVSILIPARNEEENIAACLRSALGQTYPNSEVLVLDDHSEDATATILEEMAATDPRLRWMRGQPLPEGWKGKNWACQQLADQARGEILLFVDADVRLAPEALTAAVGTLRDFELQMLSVFPTQRLGSVGEWLLVPLMNWVLLSFLPLRMVFTSRTRSFVAANGQLILMRREAYTAMGGHRAVRHLVVEDMEIARRLKARWQPIMTLVGGKLVFCRMYSGLGPAVEGFTKNFYRGFNIPASLFVLLLMLLAVIFTAPFFLAAFHPPFLALVGLILAERTLVALISRQNPLVTILLHPLQMLFMVYVGFRSAIASSRGHTTWKGRPV